jgi:hypothetical protein
MTIGIKIKKIEKIKKKNTNVYDIEIEDAHHYIFEDGTLSHNSYVPTKEMGGGCLVAGTKIQTENGSIPIESIQVGDKVRTMFGYSSVTDTFHFTDKDVYELELEDGETIRCSGEHKFLVDTGDGYEWKSVTELLPSDTIKSICIRGGMERIVKSIKKIKTEDVYDITVEGEHHYILGNGVVSHNSGLKYAASTIIYLSKKKEKDGTEVVGNLIKAKTHKSRLSKENKEVEIRLYYDERGLDRYYGLLELGEIGGLWKNVAGRYEMNGKKIYAKQILKDPEVYFTDEVMQKLDEIARVEFSYGS